VVGAVATRVEVEVEVAVAVAVAVGQDAPVPEFKVVLNTIFIVNTPGCNGSKLQRDVEPYWGGGTMHRCRPQRQFYGVPAALELRYNVLGRWIEGGSSIEGWRERVRACMRTCMGVLRRELREVQGVVGTLMLRATSSSFSVLLIGPCRFDTNALSWSTARAALLKDSMWCLDVMNTNGRSIL
jgi:hypothetical protein